ncbi:MAG TPA: GAF domain-containing protein [Terriglobales bacterium]|nr:GAF domain-containing protein [Terriglobales bacterium]
MNSENKYGLTTVSHDADAKVDFRLAAARRRLAESCGKEDAIEALREIAGNFLGSEEICLFLLNVRTKEIEIVWSFGIDPANCDLLGCLSDVGVRRIAEGECHVELASDGSVAGTKAFVPIRVANDTVAVVAILRLLPQKLGFDRTDMDLLALLSEEAGGAIFGPTLKTPTRETMTDRPERQHER